ncbi:MAG: signal peptidase I [Chloroflexota bacterium]|uniref:signal peptidase I n=1 Tax=marine metagenome TaxID=408172 RepID=A0A381PG60_9ZZZZ|nr:signal peptidase I [Chloroflexota bacterium]
MARVGKEIIEALVLAAVVFMLLQTTMRNFRVEGSSMDPTLEHGQYLLVNRLVYLNIELDRLAKIVPFWRADEGSSRKAIHAPYRGEVIVFEFPDKNPNNPRKDFVKRVVGLPGETIRMHDGVVFVDGVELDEPYLAKKDHSDASEVTLREGEYYVLGDNRAHSNDSRSWSAVPDANLRGKALMVYWPAPGIQILNILDRIPGFG